MTANRLFTCALLLLALLLAGCPSVDSPQDDRSGNLPPEGSELVLLVVDDPSMAAAIEQLRGEWSAQTGSDFRVEPMSSGELTAAEMPRVDALIAPSWQIGPLAESAEIVPVPDAVLENERGRWSDVFSLLRAHGCLWRKQVVGVPFGTPVLTIYYRADLLETLDRKPPQTWAEYQQLAELLGDRGRLGDAAPPEGRPWYGAIEPLGPGWAGQLLLARAAPYASHRENFSTLFDVDTMEPLIDGPPFVRALEDLVAAAADGPADQLTYDPGAVRAAFWRGECGLALSWPTATESAVASVSVGFAELPGSPDAYDVADRAWEPRQKEEAAHVPLLGVVGRIGFVSKSSKWPEAAFRLLLWLSDEQSTQVCPASPATTMFRISHTESPQIWMEEQAPAPAAVQYAEVNRKTLSRPVCLFALRIPGRPDYLAALDEAVHRALSGKQKPGESLREAADAWREITKRLGLERQRQAHWNSLGLD